MILVRQVLVQAVEIASPAVQIRAGFTITRGVLRNGLSRDLEASHGKLRQSCSCFRFRRMENLHRHASLLLPSNHTGVRYPLLSFSVHAADSMPLP